MTAYAAAVHPARWGVPTDDGRVRCTLCPRQCTLSEGQRGFCFVRANRAGRLVSTTYGRSSGFCVDPIEKKPLAHFHPGTSVLSFGTAGCNLGCRHCQNHEISTARSFDRLTQDAPPALIARSASELGCRSVAYTYNDPVVFAEYAIDTAWACREAGVLNVAVTAGYLADAARADFFAPMDAANVDLKAFNDDFYRRYTGGDLATVLATLAFLRGTDVWFEVTTLLIPGLNDSDDELRRLSRWLVAELGPDVPLHFSAFHPAHRLRDVPATPRSTLRRARRLALDAGLRYVYTGNVHDAEGDTTFCPECGARVIERDWFALASYRLDADGACRACGTAIPGRFEARPGNYGPRSVPVRLNP